MDNNTAMEYLSDLMKYYIELLPFKSSLKKSLKEACNLGISALKTIEDMKGDSLND